jgi:hypothetical protein
MSDPPTTENAVTTPNAWHSEGPEYVDSRRPLERLNRAKNGRSSMVHNP